MKTHTLDHRGCRLAYKVRGSGFPVLMIQGVGVHGDANNPQVDGLAPHAEVLTFDNRGMAASQPVGDGLTLEQMGEDALALMDAQGWSSAHVIGHSMGGLIALDLALRSKARVRSLSLLCTFGRGAEVGRSGRMIWLGIRSNVGTRRMRRRAFLEMIWSPEARAAGDLDRIAEDLAPLMGHDLADSPPIAMKQLRALAKYDALPRLAELSGIPALVVSAKHDPIAPPAFGRKLAGGLPGARYVELDASHAVPLEKPEVVNGLLLEHLVAAEGKFSRA